MNLTITKKQLIEFGAYEDGLARFMTRLNNTDEAVEIASLVEGKTTLVGGKNKIAEILWIAKKLGLKDKIRIFALKCARLVELIEEFRKETIECNDAIETYLNNKNNEHLVKMLDAKIYAGAAASYAKAAYAAASCACAKSDSNVAYEATDAATYASAFASAEIKAKMEYYLKEIFTTQEVKA